MFNLWVKGVGILQYQPSYDTTAYILSLPSNRVSLVVFRSNILNEILPVNKHYKSLL